MRGDPYPKRLSAALVRHLAFPLWVRRDHPHFHSYLREFQRTQFYSPEALRRLQVERLRSILIHAREHCAFYRDRFKAAGFAPENLQDTSDIACLPLLTKRDLQQEISGLTASNISPAEYLPNQTGGSTGSPVQFLVDRRRFDSRKASTARHDSWAGYRPGDWLALAWGARADMQEETGLRNRIRKEVIYRTIQLNTSAIQHDDWKRWIAGVRRKRPRVMLAYAQSAVLVAKYFRQNKIDDVKFSSIITSSEVLSDDQRELLESTFSAKVFNRYGCREVSVIASECEFHTGMHVNAEALLVEVVPDAATAPLGKIVVTDLLNRSMPLIRYEIGDVGKFAELQQCPCGRGLPLLEKIEGRITDFLALPDGTRLSGVGLLTWVFADMKGVSQLQFVQQSAHDVMLKIVPGPAFSKDIEEEIHKRMQPYLRGQVTLRIVTVPEIAKERSGKFRFVINDAENQSAGKRADA